MIATTQLPSWETFVGAFNSVAELVEATATRNGFRTVTDRIAEDAVGQRQEIVRERSFPEALALMHAELSEALEAYRLGDPASEHITGFTCIEEELADTIIRIMDTAHHAGYQVAEALLAKVLFNQTRPYRHGNKRL